MAINLQTQTFLSKKIAKEKGLMRYSSCPAFHTLCFAVKPQVDRLAIPGRMKPSCPEWVQPYIGFTASCSSLPGPPTLPPGITFQKSLLYTHQGLTAELNQEVSGNCRDLLIHHYTIFPSGSNA